MLLRMGEGFERVMRMNYRKLDKGMKKTGIEYSIQGTDSAIQIKTDPDENGGAQRNIQPALGRHEACVNSALGKFSIIQIDVRTYKVRVEPEENLES